MPLTRRRNICMFNMSRINPGGVNIYSIIFIYTYIPEPRWWYIPTVAILYYVICIDTTYSLLLRRVATGEHQKRRRRLVIASIAILYYYYYIFEKHSYYCDVCAVCLAPTTFKLQRLTRAQFLFSLFIFSLSLSLNIYSPNNGVFPLSVSLPF